MRTGTVSEKTANGQRLDRNLQRANHAKPIQSPKSRGGERASGLAADIHRATVVEAEASAPIMSVQVTMRTLSSVICDGRNSTGEEKNVRRLAVEGQPNDREGETVNRHRAKQLKGEQAMQNRAPVPVHEAKLLGRRPRHDADSSESIMHGVRSMARHLKSVEYAKRGFFLRPSV